jgi:hypothetical protein
MLLIEENNIVLTDSNNNGNDTPKHAFTLKRQLVVVFFF